jgi:hypothetical protein
MPNHIVLAIDAFMYHTPTGRTYERKTPLPEDMMIKASEQVWEVGEAVKVGFMTLRVIAKIPTPGNGLPDQYALTNNGCTRVESLADAMVPA